MKIIATFIMLTLLTYIDVSSAYAETTVNVTSNTNSSRTNNSSVKSKTDIKITTNGETKEFHSDGTSDIDYTSKDGKTRVSVKNNTVTTNEGNMQEPTAVTSTKAQPTPTEVEEKNTEEEEEEPEISDNRPFPSVVIERFKSILNGIASRMFNFFSPNK